MTILLIAALLYGLMHVKVGFIKALLLFAGLAIVDIVVFFVLLLLL